ncbi:hypothetical protein ACH5RR_018273 [Cinchona calisaya]|uniref:Uncharacterized protein n=1 Tax=Cinchona calisaya TaxID=153742 RepID=A0ABD2ZKX9_9GENT
MANQNNGDSYMVLNLTIEALRKEKETTKRVNEKHLDRIVEEKQRIQCIGMIGIKKGTLFAALERMDAQAPTVEPNPEKNSEDDPEENLGNDLGVDPMIDIEDDPEEDPNEEW